MTLDDDVAAHLQRLARETGRPFKQIINEALRAGLTPQQATLNEDLLLPAFDLGLRPGIDLTKARHLAADTEDGETVRKLKLRK